MEMTTPRIPPVLRLRAGDHVEVRSTTEILGTLDSTGCLDALPFMPEMLQYCGKRFRVYKRADKTCDTIGQTGSRRMMNAVHLDGLRCDGESHGGCQATCLLFWKEAWLKRVEDGDAFAPSATITERISTPESAPTATPSGCSCEALHKTTRAPMSCSESGSEQYACQATELLKATSPLAWWDIRQYVRDLHSGNVRLSEFIPVASRMMYNTLIRRMRGSGVPGGYRLGMIISSLAGERWNMPEVCGTREKTPTESLQLQPGELVQVKSKEEILATLDRRRRNRGLWFDVEMVKYCGGSYRVLKRVDRIIEERSGKMMAISNPCIILEGVTCCAHFSDRRLFCPRNIYPYWREIWLRRVS